MILGIAVRDTSISTSKALAQLISPKHQLFQLKKFQKRIKQILPQQQEVEMQNVATHIEECRNMDESQGYLINNLSSRVIELERLNLLYPPGQAYPSAPVRY